MSKEKKDACPQTMDEEQKKKKMTMREHFNYQLY